MELNAFSFQNHNCDGKPSGLLLKAQIPVAGEKYVKAIFHSQSEQLSILDSAPTQLLSRGSCALRTLRGQPPIQALVNQDTHGLDRF